MRNISIDTSFHVINFQRCEQPEKKARHPHQNCIFEAWRKLGMICIPCFVQTLQRKGNVLLIFCLERQFFFENHNSIQFYFKSFQTHPELRTTKCIHLFFVSHFELIAINNNPCSIALRELWYNSVTISQRWIDIFSQFSSLFSHQKIQTT